MHLPLTQWLLEGENLPERLLDTGDDRGFSLPGADALGAFADLIAEDEDQQDAAKTQGVSYSAGGFFEEDLCGEITLSREIDFGALEGDRALITFAHLAGSGEILLDETSLMRFGAGRQEALKAAYDLTGMPGAIAVDLTDALHLGRKETLRLRFDAQRPAGVIGVPILCASSMACLSRVSIQPDVHRRMMTVRARVWAQRAGRYVLRIQAVPGRAGRALPPARETDVTLEAGQEKGLQLALALDAPVFAPGQAYAAPALKIQLFARAEKEKRDGILCDHTLLSCGYGAPAPRSFLPLDEKSCLGDPMQLCRELCALGIHAVSLPLPAPDGLYQAMTQMGIAGVQYVSEEIRPLFTRWPCLSLCDAPPAQDEASLAGAAWQMAGSVSFPRGIDPAMTEDEMLLDAAGRALNQQDPTVCNTLAWLRAVQVRLRAEAARQGRYQGALCCAQEIKNGDIQDALRTAFAPIHLSALPLSGAWWTGTRFCASLEAFIADVPVAEGEIRVSAVLEDDDGKGLAQLDAPCPRGGYVGVIEAQLPDQPCVLTLRCALLCGEKTIEESILPVYVGERGPLEAAFQ